jgi:hypothetical protein
MERENEQVVGNKWWRILKKQPACIIANQEFSQRMI